MMRAFIAIDVEMNDEMEKVYEMLEATEAKLKFVSPSNVHLTLKFLGEIDEAIIPKIKKIMEEAVQDIEPFKAKIKGMGVFPSLKNIRVIWLGFHDEGQAVKIARNIDEGVSSLGFKKEKEHKPHVTIARMKSGYRKEQIIKIVEENRTKEFGEIYCESIKLKQSILKPEGPIYKTVEEIKL